MRRLLCIITTLIALNVYAGDQKNYVSILLGYQFSTANYTAQINPYVYLAGSMDGGVAASLDGGHLFSDRFGLHYAIYFNDIPLNQQVVVPPVYPQEPKHASTEHLYVLELGPEFLIYKAAQTQVYAQLNVGGTISSAHDDYAIVDRFFDFHQERHDAFAYGAALGVRYYFTEHVGITSQVAYHHINGWYIPNFWDARVGVTVRF